MPNLTSSQESELLALQSLLAAAGTFLEWLALESGALPADMAADFRPVLVAALERLRQVGERLGAIEDSDDATWARLDDTGLTGDALRLKLRVWQRLTAVNPAATPPIRGREADQIDRRAAFVVRLLGQVATVFPSVTLARTFGDDIVAVADYRRATSRLPGASER